MAIPLPPGVNANFRWAYWAYYYGNIDGCVYSIGAQANAQKRAETFIGRKVWWQNALGGAAGGSPFNPTCRDWTGNLTTLSSSNQPITQAGRWQSEVLDVISGVSSKVNHPTFTLGNILGTRGIDPTFPGHAAITAWNPGGANTDGNRTNYVELSVQNWAALLATLPELTIFRFWHEFGNGAYATDGATFKANWRKIVTYLVDLGVMCDFTSPRPWEGSAKAMVNWCPAAHGDNPHDDSDHFPGSAYVHWISRDIYTHRSPNTEFHEAGQAWYDSYHPDTGSGPGPLNPDNRPLIVSESDQEPDDPAWHRKTSEQFQRYDGSWPDNHLAGTNHDGPWDGISAALWWDDQAIPAAEQAWFKTQMQRSDFLAESVTEPGGPGNPPVTVTLSTRGSGTAAGFVPGVRERIILLGPAYASVAGRQPSLAGQAVTLSLSTPGVSSATGRVPFIVTPITPPVGAGVVSGRAPTFRTAKRRRFRSASPRPRGFVVLRKRRRVGGDG